MDPSWVIGIFQLPCLTTGTGYLQKSSDWLHFVWLEIPEFTLWRFKLARKTSVDVSIWLILPEIMGISWPCLIAL